MTKQRLLFLLVALGLTFVVGSSDASAQVFGAQGFGGRVVRGGALSGGRLGIGSNSFFGTNFRSPSSLYSLGYAGIPPQFALHPPVYYSAPVARPYGYSPFPLPAGVAPAEPIFVKPVEVKNPFFVPSAPKTDAEPQKNDGKKKGKQASVAKVIVNPYYVANPEWLANDAELDDARLVRIDD